MNCERSTTWRLSGLFSAIAFAFTIVLSASVAAQERKIDIDDPALRNKVVLAILPDLKIQVSSSYADTAFELITVYGDQLQRRFNRNAYQIHAATYGSSGFTQFMIEVMHFVVRSLHLQDRLVQLLDPSGRQADRDLARYYLWLDGQFLKPTDPLTDGALFDAAIAYVSKPRTLGSLHFAYTIGSLKDDDLFVRRPAQSIIDRHFKIGMLPSAPFYFFDQKIEPLKDDMVDLNFQAFSDSLVGRDTAPLIEKIRANKAEVVK